MKSNVDRGSNCEFLFVILFQVFSNQQQKLILLPDVTELINEDHICAQMEPDNLQEMAYAVGLNYGKTL